MSPSVGAAPKDVEFHAEAMAARIHKLVLEAVPTLVPQDVLRDAGVRQRREGDLLLQAEVEVQVALLRLRIPGRLDDGEMWPVSFAVVKLTAATEKRIAELVKKGANGP